MLSSWQKLESITLMLLKKFKDMKLDLQSKDFPEVFQMPIVLLYKSPPGTSWNASSSEPAVNSREKI